MKKVLFLLLIVLAYSCNEEEHVIRRIKDDGSLGGKEIQMIDTAFKVGDTITSWGDDYIIIK